MTDRQRKEMIERQLKRRGIKDPRILDAFAAIPREKFVSEGLADRSYDDGPLPIGQRQTISQPYIVALMLELLELKPTDRLLEVGFGSGYAAAVASKLVARVYGIERIAEFKQRARDRIGGLGIDNVELRTGDGSKGWIDAAPFDAILVSAATATVPPQLKAQLADGGRLVIPVGGAAMQELSVIRRQGDKWTESKAGGVRFVPLVSNS